MNKNTRTQIVVELMGQASEYKALGKIAEALDIYERILKRTEYDDEKVIEELAKLYDSEKRAALYKTAAFHALARFDKKNFIEYCKLLGEDLSFSVISKDDHSIRVILDGNSLEIQSDIAEEIPQQEEVVDEILVEQEETEKKTGEQEGNVTQKKKKSLPSLAEIADVLQSGGVEQALYMLETLENEQLKDLWYLRALCYVAKNDMESAKMAIETELSLYPNNDKAKHLAVDIGRVIGKKIV